MDADARPKAARLHVPRPLSHDPRTGNVSRQHLHEGALQRAVKAAVHAAGLTKPIAFVILMSYCMASSEGGVRVESGQ